MAEFAERVLGLVSEPDYRPMTQKAMSRHLQVQPALYPEFRRTVKDLIQSGKLHSSRDKTLRLPDRSGMIVGLFRRSAKGFGFVRPHHAVPGIDQVYIPPESTRDASTGDEVTVKITRTARRGGLNAEGRVVEVLSRAAGVFVGSYLEAGATSFVKVDGTTFNDPISVGDPGAKGARPGDKVVIEILQYPSPFNEGEGVIVEVLGPHGQPGVDTLSIIRAFDIPDTFDEAVLEEAREQAQLFDETKIGSREDLRSTKAVTIDPANARDFDDAISLSRDEKGHWSLGVHIADVAHFVPSGSTLDRVARNRGTSVYLPDRVIPMLPEILSNGLASLQAGRTRFTLTAHLDFNSEGILTGKRFARSAIKVEYRFSYEQAMPVMKEPARPHSGVAPEIATMLGQMLELAMILRNRRKSRGALELSLPEVEIELADDGRVAGAHLAEHDESHQVIEEFMLAANEAVATMLSENEIGFLRRAHPDPEPFKLDQFAEFARSLGLKLDQPQSRFEIQRVLHETIGSPEEYAVHYGLLRSLKQASYTPEPESSHFALASQNYCHFTSPIRRYPDLQVHRQLIAWLAGKQPSSHHDELFALGQHCTRTERRAEAAERDLIKIKLLAYLSERIGQTFHAIIVGVEDFGLFCRLAELPVDGLIHVSSLSDDFYYLEPGTHTLVGRRSGRRHRLGDRELVRVVHVDVDRRVLDLTLADSIHPQTRRPGQSRTIVNPPLPHSSQKTRRTARPNEKIRTEESSGKHPKGRSKSGKNRSKKTRGPGKKNKS
jgi:ribonuclease R